MTITDLTIKNFGRISELKLGVGAPTLCIAGPNGSGKTTVALCIKWLLTGRLPDNGSTYVRNVETCTERGAKAEASLTASHKGHTIQVSRQMSSKGVSKVTLVVDDEPEITRAATADERLSILFGADKHVVDSVTFVQQGDLDKLFSDDAGRKELFYKLLGLSNIPKVEKALEKLISTAAAGVRDFTPEITLLRDQISQKQTTVTSSQAALSEIPDKSADKAAALHAREVYRTYQNVNSSYTAAARSADAIDNDERALLARMPISPESELRKTIAEQQATLDTLRSTQQSNLRILAERKLVAQAEETLESTKATIADYLTRIMPVLDEVEAEEKRKKLIKLQQIVTTITNDHDALERLKLYQENASAAKEKLDALHYSEEVEAAVRKESEAASTLGDFEITVLSTFLGGKAGSKCPICGSEHLPDPEEARRRLEFRRQQKEEHTRRLRESVQRYNTYALAKRDYDNAAAKVVEAESMAPKDVAGTRIRYKTLSALKTEIREIENTLNLRPATLSQNAAIEKAVATLRLRQAELETTIAAKKPDVERMKDVQPSETDAAQIISLETSLRRLQAFVRELDVLNSRKAARQDVTSFRSAWDKARAALDAQLLALGVQENELEARWTATLAEIETLESRRVNLNAVVSVTKEQIEADEKKILSLEAQARGSAEKQERISKLRELKEVIGMDGEPGKYLAAVFSLVVSGASSYLEQLNSTFRIVADPNEPLGLRFYDLTNMEGGAQPHTKLSGAQRVRTSVAFLLALHDIVVPDLGLLVLDEPSNHLDEAAVFDLRNLLLKLRPVLAQRGAQLWVIDHEPAIQGAADIVVPLKAQTADAP